MKGLSSQQANAATAQLVLAGFAVEVIHRLEAPEETAFSLVARKLGPAGELWIVLHLRDADDVEAIQALLHVAPDLLHEQERLQRVAEWEAQGGWEAEAQRGRAEPEA